ncbi:hypothetical protein L873DRAFT_1112002 [Choiromyces venosus 120613-1]|uniref:Uncharacterized protein n=1 Tax=Choiromyces venosus 120613-1 TaxID=1336337 RepID=A0A3N4JMA2_9PEZI|nr:hypothetical protein L873DRAFT_1112002 [Choiromyces venosus 120613-1]
MPFHSSPTQHTQRTQLRQELYGRVLKSNPPTHRIHSFPSLSSTDQPISGRARRKKKKTDYTTPQTKPYPPPKPNQQRSHPKAPHNRPSTSSLPLLYQLPTIHTPPANPVNLPLYLTPPPTVSTHRTPFHRVKINLSLTPFLPCRRRYDGSVELFQLIHLPLFSTVRYQCATVSRAGHGRRKF